MDRLALIAGGGALPKLIVEERQKHGKEIYIIAFRGFTDPDLIASHPHHWVKLGQLGKTLELLKKQRIDTLVFAGHIKRPSWNQIRPDWQGFKMLWRLRRQKPGDDSLLRQLASVFQEQGIELIGADTILPECLMPAGQLTDVAPDAAQLDDIAHASRILSTWAAMDQGQAIVVQHGLILGVEAIEGTDELVRRCAAYKRPGAGPILVKMKKPQQDTRLDLPTIGEQTIKTAIEAGFSGIAVQAGNALFLQPGNSTETASRNRIFLYGFTPEPDAR